MTNSGFIMRFVDVVLIMLFGFITISNLQDSEVALPESGETDLHPMDTEEVEFIGILPDGTFLIEDEQTLISSVEALRGFLAQRRAAAGVASLKIRIRSSWDAPVHYALDVAALCDELGLQKSIEVELNLNGV
ncbi:MAG: biopolymer transporter ExbD [Rhodothermales bacterium]|nr:biopolymer transporter ExbD [Rhodothermales bacterium]